MMANCGWLITTREISSPIKSFPLDTYEKVNLNVREHHIDKRTRQI